MEDRDKVYQLLAYGLWFTPGTPVSYTTKTGHHDINVHCYLKTVKNEGILSSAIFLSLLAD
jgi:hypothetical protein